MVCERSIAGHVRVLTDLVAGRGGRRKSDLRFIRGVVQSFSCMSSSYAAEPRTSLLHRNDVFRALAKNIIRHGFSTGVTLSPEVPWKLSFSAPVLHYFHSGADGAVGTSTLLADAIFGLPRDMHLLDYMYLILPQSPRLPLVGLRLGIYRKVRDSHGMSLNTNINDSTLLHSSNNNTNLGRL
jgi:hypothetical protein